MYKIREARLGDFAELAKLNDTCENIHLAAEPGKLEKEFFVDCLKQDNVRLLVVEKSGVIVAFILFRMDQTAGEFHIDKLSIKSGYAGKGLDEHLYQKLERLAVKKDAVQITATISTTNLAVHDFFKRNGWKQKNQVYIKYLEGEN
ncbi:hypothetical protein GCM10011409_22470 [Lentibacillus populi]|uniref:N-acetyltransferase domain-containing protein n=1 Tax=Lentibacillus populi TaxID=1827502 RepID=A0A9W5X5Z9_9BACI|nr:GNAT family N-acetyltransferase [Lentibacillus populi]GGB44409.1 hypothetical protein GCM10011409_22470 [Lentibacillus populi]